MDEATDVTGGPSRVRLPRSSREGLVVGGAYRISSHLAAGNMGDVYEAEHLRLRSIVAIKFLRGGARSDACLRRFRDEARRMAAARCENVVSVFDYGELEDGTPYIVMDRLPGEDLRSLLAREGALPVRRAISLVRDACHGLCVVHAAGLVHRDLKPANLFVVRRQSGTELCKILDFGVAKAATSTGTQPGTLLGTVRYMAPEQLENCALVGPAADVYALGAILYECLTGAPAHGGDTVPEMMFDILHRDPLAPSTLCVLPSDLERIVLRALSRDLSKRFSSAEQLAQALMPFGAIEYNVRRVEPPEEETVAEHSRIALRAPERLDRPVPRRGSIFVAVLIGIAIGWMSRITEQPVLADVQADPNRHDPMAARSDLDAVHTVAMPQALPVAVPAPSLIWSPQQAQTTRMPKSKKTLPVARREFSARKTQPPPPTGYFDTANPYTR